MRRLLVFTLLMTFVLLSSCKQAGGDSNAVKVRNFGVFNPVDLILEGGTDKGEFLIGSDPVVFTVTVINTSTYDLTDVQLILDENSTASMKFTPNLENKSLAPGFGGNCSSVVPKNTECEFKLTYTPTFPGNLSQKVSLHYKNLVNAEVIEKEMKLLAGEAASLIFKSEKTSYDFGVLERTETKKIVEIMDVKNTGGLTARNIIFGKFDVPDSGAYVVTSNNCPNSISPGQECRLIIEFSPMNYDAGAPDGDGEVIYTSNVKFEYERDPSGGKSALNAYFNALSTTIEGKFLAGGLEAIDFDDLTVGNFQTKTFKIQNQGYKEAIIHRLDILNASGVVVGSCVRETTGSNQLACRDPGDHLNPSALLTLEQLPLKLTDNTQCMSPVDQMDYTRDATTGEISDLTIKQVVGKKDGIPGDSCFFNLTFHPSVNFTTNGNIANFKIRVVYDSTWKNQIVMKGDQAGDDHQFLLQTANYFSAAKLDVNTFLYGADTFTNFDLADNGLFKYDLGRVALISNAAYKKPLKTTLKNIGGSYAEIVSIKDAATVPFQFSDTAVNINNYYRSATHVSCSFLAPTAGQCDLKMDLTPLASTLSDGTLAQNEENGYMYDVNGVYPDKYKKFIIEYKDSTSVEDDGTPRANRKIEVWIRALLVRKGYLVFEDVSTAQGTGLKEAAGNTKFFHVKVKNVGTGGIPYIKVKSGFDLLGTTQKAGGQPFPYEIVDRATGEGGATKDCFDIVTFDGSAPTGVAPNTNAASLLDADQSCSLTIKMQLKSNDVLPTGAYNTSNPEWGRYYESAVQNTEDAWEKINYFQANEEISFEYYDGDGIEDVANGYIPDLQGYGNFYQIAGGSSGLYKLDIDFFSQAKLVPKQPYPMVTAVLCRDNVTLPAITPSGTEWGTAITATSVPETCMDFHDGIATTPVTYFSNSADDVKADNAGYDYIFYAGTYKEGATYKFGFSVNNSGALQAHSVSENLAPLAGLSKITSLASTLNAGSSKKIDFLMSPAGVGHYETDYLVTYKNQRTNLTSEAALTYTDQTVNFKVKIVYDVVASTEAEFSLTGQDYLVLYDKDLDSIDDTTPIAGTQSYNLLYNESDLGQFVRLKAIRGSKVYAKKELTFTNTGGASVSEVRFNIKASADAASLQNTKGGAGYSIASNGCNNITLAPAETCKVILWHKAGNSEPLETAVHGTLVYKIDTNSYQQRNFQIKFLASDPAILQAAGIAFQNIYDESGNVIQGAFPINLGTYTGSHPILSDFPTHRVSKLGIKIENTSTEKASFLRQWDEFSGGAPLPGTAYIEIFNQSGKIVEASRSCFFGDDEYDAGVDADKKGFMSTSISSCLMNFHYDLGNDYLGKVIDTSKSYVRLLFYNNERSSEDAIYLYFSGFVEPNKSVATNAIYDVETTESKTLSFSWTPATPNNGSWGAVTGYRVFYSATQSPLNNVFQNTVNYVDTSTPSVLITSGLTNGKYYYIKVFAKRTTSGKEYLSDMGMSTKTVIVPPNGMFYNYDLGVLVSKSAIIGASGTKAEAVAACDARTTILSKNGASSTPKMKLITSAIYDLIDADPANSNYSYKAVPHWINDPPVDIEPIFSPGFDCSNPTGTDGNNSFYSKSCTDCSCNMLSLIVGGDGADIPYGAYLYVEPTLNAIYRCYVTQ